MNRHDEDETFLVIDGDVEFIIGNDRHLATAGDVMSVPNRVPHVFTNVGNTVSTMLLIHRPGDAHVGFFFGAGDAVPDGTKTFPAITAPDIPRLVAIAASACVEILPPA